MNKSACVQFPTTLAWRNAFTAIVRRYKLGHPKNVHLRGVKNPFPWSAFVLPLMCEEVFGKNDQKLNCTGHFVPFFKTETPQCSQYNEWSVVSLVKGVAIVPDPAAEGGPAEGLVALAA